MLKTRSNLTVGEQTTGWQQRIYNCTYKLFKFLFFFSFLTREIVLVELNKRES